MKEVNIREKLSDLGLKINFWYDDGKLDAICVAKWVGEDLVLQKKYSADEVAGIILADFIRKDSNE